MQVKTAVYAACWTLVVVVNTCGFSPPSTPRRSLAFTTVQDRYTAYTTHYAASASRPGNDDDVSEGKTAARKENPGSIDTDDNEDDDDLYDFEIEDLFDVFLDLDDNADDPEERDDEDENDEIDLDDLLRALESKELQSQDMQEIISKAADLEIFTMNQPISAAAAEILEKALLQGVVPVGANVGSDKIPGDLGFDPLNFSERDWIPLVQNFLLNLLPGPRYPFDVNNNNDAGKKTTPLSFHQSPRPKALIIRDYREAEIRHGRLAMLAAVIWPLQELVDELILPTDLFGPLIYGPVTLPYFPISMTAILLLLGYLDIYSQVHRKSGSLSNISAFHLSQLSHTFWAWIVVGHKRNGQYRRSLLTR